MFLFFSKPIQWHRNCQVFIFYQMYHSGKSLVKCCVGVFADLGGDYSVVRKSLLYEGLRSWRRLLVSNVNCPTVYPVLLTNTLQSEKKGKGIHE